jgi:5-methylcytosine-specific restriction endonuclease McrA
MKEPRVYTHSCKNCGKFLKSWGMYCSVSCSKIYKKERINPTRFQIFERDNFRCVICGRGARDNVKLEIDHWVPTSQGGQDNIENCVTLCKDCNTSKSDKIPKISIKYIL